MITRDSILDDLKEIQKDPVSLRRIFLILTRNHFSNPDHYGNVSPDFKKFVFSDNLRDSSLKIMLDYTYNDKVIEKRPAIFVGIGDFKFGNKIHDNFVSALDDGSGNNYVRAVQTDVKLIHIAPTADEALQLGVLSSSFYIGLSKLLQSKLCLDRCDVVALSKPNLIKNGSDSHFRVDLYINLEFQFTWVTTIESHRIKKIIFDIDTK